MKRLCRPSSTRISKTETPFHAKQTVFSFIPSALLWSGNCHMDSMLPQTVPRLRLSPVTVEWITRTGDIRTLAPDWRPLQSTVKNRTVFSSFDLLAAWYENYAGDYGGEPLIGLARGGGRLVGVAPLVVRLAIEMTNHPNAIVAL